MPDKYELAQHLVNLHTLMEAQSQTGLNKSQALADEYSRNWDTLKEMIENETGSSDE